MSSIAVLTSSSTQKNIANGFREELQTLSGSILPNGYEHKPLWTGPSMITTIRTGKTQPFQSLLKINNREKTAINKQHRNGPVYLGRVGFEGDEQTYYDHGGPEKAVLQFNPNNYLSWQKELKGVMVKDDLRRASLLSPGSMGENLGVQDPLLGPPMDEHTMCIGDVVSIRSQKRTHGHARLCVTGPRQPCFKLNHRFGIANMSQRAQDQSRTGWLYSVLKNGDVEVGDELVLLERPHPEWPVARVQYYLYKEPRNFDMIKTLLDEIADILVYDVRNVFKNRFEKGVEDMNLRLDGGSSKQENFVKYQLSRKTYETPRISDFVFTRIDQLPKDSSEFATAEPGSHIRLKIKLSDQSNMELIRPYSIISGDSNSFRLGIALSDTSRGGSSYLHRELSVGDVIEASGTITNTFPLIDSEKADDHVFLAGGIGVTAFLDHIQHCIHHNIPFQLHYMVRNKSDVAFISLIDTLLTKHNSLILPKPIHIYDSSTNNSCDVKAVIRSIAGHLRTHIYTCGSERLSNAVTEAARMLEIPEDRLHFEQFSIDASGDPFTTNLSKSQNTIRVRAEQSLLEALRETGFEVPSSCEAGNCGTCRVRVKSGKIVHRGTGLAADEKAGEGDEGEQGEMLSCVSRGVGVIELEL